MVNYLHYYKAINYQKYATIIMRKITHASDLNENSYWKWAKNLCKKEHTHMLHNIRQAMWYWKSTMSLAFAYFKPKTEFSGTLQLITHYSRLQ